MQFTKKNLFFIVLQTFFFSFHFERKKNFFYFYFKQQDYLIFAMLIICFAIKFHFDLNFLKSFSNVHTRKK